MAMAVLKGDAWSRATSFPRNTITTRPSTSKYLEHSSFLAHINNERTAKNAEHKMNIIQLENFVMYTFEDDTTVIPKETAWFEEANAHREHAAAHPQAVLGGLTRPARPGPQGRTQVPHYRGRPHAALPGPAEASLWRRLWPGEPAPWEVRAAAGHWP